LIDIVRRGRDARAAAVAGLWLELFAGASKSIALLSDGSVGCPWFGRGWGDLAASGLGV